MLTVVPDAVTEPEPGARWSCAACCGQAASEKIEKDGFYFRVCATCGTASLDPLPSKRETAEIFGEDYFVGGANGGYRDYLADESLHRRNARIRLRAIARSGAGVGKMLDVGCASGFFLSQAQRRGWDVMGMDIAPWAAREARARFDIRVCSDLESIERESVDVVCMSQVLEHSLEPLDLLRRGYRCLRPHGLLFVETWDRGSAVARLFGAQWQQITPPSVVHLFTRSGISSVLARTGFDDPKFARAAKFVSLGFVAGLLGQKYPRLPRFLRETASTGSVGRLPLPYFFGDLIHVTARRA